MPTMLCTSLARLRARERVAEARERARSSRPHLAARAAPAAAERAEGLAASRSSKPISMRLASLAVARVDRQRAASRPPRRTVSVHRRRRAAAVAPGAGAAVRVDRAASPTSTVARPPVDREDPVAGAQHALGRLAASRPPARDVVARPRLIDGSRLPSVAAPLRLPDEQHRPEQHERDQRCSRRARRGSPRSASTAAGCSRRGASTSGSRSSSSSGFMPVIFT